MEQRPRILVVDDSPSILRVVETVLSGAGYDVETAPDGATALEQAKARVPHLVLLDFMMPRMNGHQVCVALRQEDSLKDVPVVLMCTKGDGAAERLVQQMGVVDYITKPFSPDAILALTSYTLEKHPAPGSTSADVFTAPPAMTENVSEEQTLIGAVPLGAMEGEATALSAAPPGGMGQAERAADHLRRVIVRSVTQALRDNTHLATHEAVASAVDEALSQLPPLTGALSDEPGRPALWGDFSLVPIPEVFQLMTLQGQTGLFQVWTEPATLASRGNARFDVYFSKGRIDFVQAVNMHEDFLLGRFLVARGAIDKVELDSLLRARKGRKLLGQQLVALGHVTRDQLKQALRDQCCELVYELMRFPRGTFCMRKDVFPPADVGDTRLAISVDELLLEGLRRVDEWGLIQTHIPDFDVVFSPDRREGGQRLTDEERYVLGLVTPETSVRAVIARSGMRPFDVCKILYRLLLARQIRALP